MIPTFIIFARRLKPGGTPFLIPFLFHVAILFSHPYGMPNFQRPDLAYKNIFRFKILAISGMPIKSRAFQNPCARYRH
jgi:hypothetical protein